MEMKEQGEQRATRNLELRASVDAKAAVKETSGEEVREEQRLQGGREVEERKAIVVGQTAPGAAGQGGRETWGPVGSNHTAPQPAGTQERVWCADYTSVLKKRQRGAYFLAAVFFAAAFFLGDFLAAVFLGLGAAFSLGAVFLTAVAFLTGDFLGEAFFLGGMPPKPIYAHTEHGRAEWSVGRGRGGWAEGRGGPRTHGRRGGNNPDPTWRHTEGNRGTRTQVPASSSAPRGACRPGAPFCVRRWSGRRVC